MRQWEYEINGSTLRELIRNEEDNSFTVLKQVALEIKFFIRGIKNEDMVFEFDDLLERVEGDISYGEENLISFLKEEDYGSMKEYVDGLLTEFYDLCDRWDIFVKS